ncbi:MAG: flippase-like domain-containing protein [Chloroflexi bacterium]|nr:flippase-like domain-containing protein [Chloroflexota bacterium]
MDADLAKENHLPPEKTPGRLNRYTRLIGLLVLVVVLVKADLGKALVVLVDVRLSLLLLAIIANLPQLGLKALRWHFLLRMQGVSYKFKHAVLAYFASFYIGILTPGRLGEFVKAFYLKQETGITIGEAVSSVLVDRLFDLYALIGVGGCGLIIFARFVSLPGWALALVCAGILASLLMLWPPVGRLALRVLTSMLIIGRHANRLTPKVESFYANLVQLLKPRLLVAVLLTISAHAIFYTQCYLLVLALDLPLEYSFVLFSMSLVNLVNLLPVTISGLGTREAVLSLLFGSAGLDSGMAIAYSALVVLTFYVGAGIMGACAWSVVPLDLGLIKRNRNTSIAR